MKITLTIDDDLVKTAKILSTQKHVPLSKVVCEVMRKGMETAAMLEWRKSGFDIYAMNEAAKYNPEITQKVEGEY